MSHLSKFKQSNPENTADYLAKVKVFLASYDLKLLTEDLAEIKSQGDLDDFRKELAKLAENVQQTLNPFITQEIQGRKHALALSQIYALINELIETEAEFIKRTGTVAILLETHRDRLHQAAGGASFISATANAYTTASKPCFNSLNSVKQLAQASEFVNQFNRDLISNEFIVRVKLLMLITHNYLGLNQIFDKLAKLKPGIPARDLSTLLQYAMAPVQRLTKLEMLAVGMLKEIKHLTASSQEENYKIEEIKQNLSSFYRKMKRVNTRINQGGKLIDALNKDFKAFLAEHDFAVLGTEPQWNIDDFKDLLPLYETAGDLLTQSLIKEEPITEAELDKSLEELKKDDADLNNLISEQQKLVSSPFEVPVSVNLGSPSAQPSDHSQRQEMEAQSKIAAEATARKLQAEAQELTAQKALAEKAAQELAAKQAAEHKAALEAERLKAQQEEVARKILAEKQALELAAKQEVERKAAEELAAQKAQAEREAQERAAKEKQDAERKAAEELAAQKAQAERAAQERAAKEKQDAERKQQEQLAKEKQAAEIKAAENAWRSASVEPIINRTIANAIALIEAETINPYNRKKQDRTPVAHKKQVQDSRILQAERPRYQNAKDLKEHLEKLQKSSEVKTPELEAAIYDLVTDIISKKSKLTEEDKIRNIGQFETTYCNDEMTFSQGLITALKVLVVLAVAVVLCAAIAASASVIITAAATGIVPAITVAGITGSLTTAWSIYAATGGAIVGTLIGGTYGIKKFFFPENLKQDVADSARKYLNSHEPNATKPKP